MKIVLVILKILAALVPVVLTLFFSWQAVKKRKAEAKKKTEENSKTDPIDAIDHGNDLENDGSSLEDASDKW